MMMKLSEVSAEANLGKQGLKHEVENAVLTAWSTDEVTEVNTAL